MDVIVLSTRNSSAARRRAGELERRAVLRRITGVASVATLAAVAGGLAASLGRLLASGPTGGSAAGGVTATPAPAGTGTPSGVKVLAASAVPVGGAAYFVDPAQQIPAYAVQPARGTFRAFSAICTHAGCTVQFEQAYEAFVCPCHGSVFDAADGSVVQGPAPSPLAGIPIASGPDGALYAGA